MNLLSKYKKLKQAINESTEHPMIEHNGKMVHRNNSEGQPIHHTDEGIKNFHNWSDGHELKDEQGRPKVVYHGTDTNFKSVDPKKGAQGLFWFASHKEDITSGDSGAASTKFIKPLYIKMKHPAGWKEYDKLGLDELEHREKHGGAILDNGKDQPGHYTGFVFKGENVKSAEKNNGNFSSNNKLHEAEDYKGEHGAPDPESGSPLHNLKGTYPDDFYTHPHYYADGSNYDHESVNVMKSVKDRPKAAVKIYRAVPKVMSHQDKLDEIFKHKRHILKHGTIPSGVVTNLNKSKYYDKIDNDQKELESNPPTSEPDKIKINKGDWVTASRSYAKDHGEGALRGKYKILSKTVKASELYTDGNSIHEYGYHPAEKTVKESIESAYMNMVSETDND